jgi:orotidine-5'-phosphate decarboxylase
MNSQCGLLVNSSRGIIYADSSENYAAVAGAEAKKLQEQMAEQLQAANLI